MAMTENTSAVAAKIRDLESRLSALQQSHERELTASSSPPPSRQPSRSGAREERTRERDEAQKEAEALKLQAQVWALEARAQKATVHACYEAITGKTGEPGDWNGAEPIRRYVAERDALALSQGRLLEEGAEWRLSNSSVLEEGKLVTAISEA